MRARSNAPEVKIGDAGVALGFDMRADLGFQVRICRVEQHRGSVTHQGPGQNGNDDRAHDAHHRVEPDPTEETSRQKCGDREDGRQRVGEDVDKGGAKIVPPW